MANRGRVSMEGRHSNNVGGGVEKIERLLHTLLEQNESLHGKVDKLSYNLNSLVEQFRREFPAVYDHPQTIDTLDIPISDHRESFESSDSSFARITVATDINDDINGVGDIVTVTNGLSDANAASHSNGVIKFGVDIDEGDHTNYRELNENNHPTQDMRTLPKKRNGSPFVGINGKTDDTSRSHSAGAKTDTLDQSMDTRKVGETPSVEIITVMNYDGRQSSIVDELDQVFEQEQKMEKHHSVGQQGISTKQSQQQSQSQGNEEGPKQHPNESQAKQPGFITSKSDLDNGDVNDKEDDIADRDTRPEDTEEEDESSQTVYTALRPTKRTHSANFGDTKPHPRSSSPLPVARHRIRTPYSYFKRRRTVIFDDNRPKYFDKVLDIESFSGAEDIMTEQTHITETSHGLEAEIPDSKPDMQVRTRNNAQMPESGLQNEHGPEDNRFDKEAHLDVGHNAHSLIHGNLTFIRHRRDDSVNGPRGSPNGQEGDEMRQGSPRNMKADSEIRALIDREKQSALECNDPKSMHGIDTVICLDTSASMSGEAMKTSKKFILDFLAGLDESTTSYNLEENVALVTFGRQNKVLQHLTNKYDLIRKLLKTIRCEGPSPLWYGVALCLTELSSRGGVCSMDSLKVSPRIIIVSDFFSSVKNYLSGPDIQQTDTKGNSEVCGIIEKNRNSVSSFDFVLAGRKTNQELLGKIGGGRVFTMADVLYLAQFFRVQDVLNRFMTKQMYEEVGVDYLNDLMKERGLTIQAQRDVKEIIKEETPLDEEVMDTGTGPGPTDTDQEDVVDDVVEPGFGTRIKASQDWVGYHTRRNMSGRVIAQRRTGLLKVVWEDGTQEKLKYGVDGEYNVIVDDTEPDIDEGNIKVGSVVERGPDWQWGEQDGGPGNIGVVTNYDSVKQVVMVLWEHGSPGNYRYGYKNKYDVTPRPLVQRLSETNERRVYWQMEIEHDSWILLPSEVTEKIETQYLSDERNTFLVNIQDIPYRFSLNSLKARNTVTNSNHAIKRLELTRAEWLHMTDEAST